MQYVNKKERCALIRSTVTEEQVFTDLIRPCQNALFATALAITRNREDALDAVQDGILRGWKKWDTLRDEKLFTTWMTRIVIRAAIDITRKRKPTGELMDDIRAEEPSKDKQLDIRRAMDGLDEKTRIAAALYYFEDMGVKDIAKVLNIRQGTVKSRLFRAREILRQTLEGYADDK